MQRLIKLAPFVSNLASDIYKDSTPASPIITSLLDTDLYKLLMLQFIWKHYRDVEVTFAIKNRTKTVHIAEEIDKEELERQLDHVRILTITNQEKQWLLAQGFDPKFVDWFKNDWTLSDYKLGLSAAYEDGPLAAQYTLEFRGPWVQTTMWEIYALAIISELRTRNDIRKLNPFEVDLLYANAKNQLRADIQEIWRPKDGTPKISDFGTRRRHSKAWQDYAVQLCMYTLGENFIGTSNCHLAMKYDIDPIGTIAHEIPMVMAALADSPDEKIQSQYNYIFNWMTMWPSKRTLLPDTFGSKQFFRNIPLWLENNPDNFAIREDSMDPFEALNFYRNELKLPKGVKLIFSDGLTFEKIDCIVGYNEGDYFDLSFGIGTNLTNNFRLAMGGIQSSAYRRRFQQISLVCKPTRAKIRDVRGTKIYECVKLSNNFDKAMGLPQEVKHYIDIFGNEGMNRQVVTV